MKLSKLKTDSRNPFPAKTKEMKELINSIKEFPEMMKLRPIVYDPKTMVIIGGNKRFKALKKIGYKDIPDCWVVSANDLTEDQKKRFKIADNVSHGVWDLNILLEDYNPEDLSDWGLIIEEEKGKKEVIETDVDDVVSTTIKEGDIIKIGSHMLICGDSTKKITFDKIIGNNYADMVFTDPPFDLEDNYSEHIFSSAKKDCHIFIMNSDRILAQTVGKHIKYFKKFFSVDFRIPHLISNSMPMTRVDLIAEFNRGKGRFNNLKDGFSTLVKCAKVHSKNKNNFGHDQAKKTELPSIFIQHYSEEGDVVFDPFLGSGTTMAACEQLNRKCIGIELIPENCQIIINRMKKINSDIKIEII